MGSLFFLQGIFLTQEPNWGLLHCWQILYQLCSGKPKHLNACIQISLWRWLLSHRRHIDPPHQSHKSQLTTAPIKWQDLLTACPSYLWITLTNFQYSPKTASNVCGDMSSEGYVGPSDVESQLACKLPSLNFS